MPGEINRLKRYPVKLFKDKNKDKAIQAGKTENFFGMYGC